MFESITFFNQNKTDTSNPLDIGALVECMLFHILWGQVYFLAIRQPEKAEGLAF